MILTKQAMKEALEKGQIEIEPLEDKLFNPNSYNVRLAPELFVYDVDSASPLTRLARKVLPGRICDMLNLAPSEIDFRKENGYHALTIPDEGLVLKPGTLYIGSTIERTHSPQHVPLYEGRSTTGRAGLESHVCAGWGDVGFNGTWTLEIRVAYPTRVYVGMEIGQVGFIEVKGEVVPYGSPEFRSRYQHQQGPVAMKPWHPKVRI